MNRPLCRVCYTPTRLDPEDPTRLTHCTTNGEVIERPHHPVPVVRCSHEEEHGGPHPGCDEFAPPVTYTCNRPALVVLVIEPEPFGSGRELACVQHAADHLAAHPENHADIIDADDLLDAMRDDEVARTSW